MLGGKVDLIGGIVELARVRGGGLVDEPGRAIGCPYGAVVTGSDGRGVGQMPLAEGGSAPGGTA